MPIEQPFGTAASTKTPITSVNVGTVATGITAVENGDAAHHRTTLTLATVLPAIAGGAALGVGKLMYTFPAGVINIRATSMSVAIQQTESNIDADTPEVSIGNIIVVGAVATMTTATWENVLTAQVADDCDGTAEVKALATSLVMEAGDAHAIYLNVADTWAASGDVAAGLTGTVVIEWDFVE